jgi:hypothetical protein
MVIARAARWRLIAAAAAGGVSELARCRRSARNTLPPPVTTQVQPRPDRGLQQAYGTGNVVPRSNTRHRRRPSPRSKLGLRRRQIPQRSRSRQFGRAATTTSPRSPTHTSSMTARRSPSSRAHTLIPRTSHPPPGFQPSRTRNPRSRAACAPPQAFTSPTGTAERPKSPTDSDAPHVQSPVRE